MLIKMMDIETILIGLSEDKILDFEKTFGKVRAEIEISKMRDQVQFRILGIWFGDEFFKLDEEEGD